MLDNQEKAYPNFAKLFAPLKKIGGWFLVKQLHVVEDGALSRGKIMMIGHFCELGKFGLTIGG